MRTSLQPWVSAGNVGVSDAAGNLLNDVGNLSNVIQEILDYQYQCQTNDEDLGVSQASIPKLTCTV